MCAYRITLYCPDTHLTYDIRALDERGVGGGVTSRIRLAHAFAARGHAVTAFVNCPSEESIDGVEYRHYTRLNGVRSFRLRPETLDSDIFIASTSGGGYDLSSLRGIRIEAKLRILMAHGIELPRGMDCIPFDFVYAPSNFIRNIAVERWGVPPGKTFVCPRGVVGAYFDILPTGINCAFSSNGWTNGKTDSDDAHPFLRFAEQSVGSWAQNAICDRARYKPVQRDSYALAYAAHPSKGLDAAIAVLRLLRQEDARFTLHVFGGEGLWASPPPPSPALHAGEGGGAGVGGEAIIHHGLVGQRQLARELTACGFSLNLQSRQEPFGMVLIESMRAGCIVLASPVGAYPEIIRDGENGLLIEGAHTDPSTHRRAADLILELIRRPAAADAIRRRAIAAPLDWDEVAQRWEAHWELAADG